MPFNPVTGQFEDEEVDEVVLEAIQTLLNDREFIIGMANKMSPLVHRGGIGDAPKDGSQYARQDGDWSVIVGGGGGGISNVVEDTTPQLGGELDAQGNNIADLGDVTFQTGATGGTLRTGTSAADKFVLQAYDVNDTTYRTVMELDAGNTVVNQIIADYLEIDDATDTTKRVGFDVSGATASTKTTLDFNQTTDKTITFPDTTGTIQLQPTEGAFVNGDKTKLDGIETSADVTDTANVTSAGALMDSELTDITFVKALSDADASTVNTGTSTTGVVTPDALAGSIHGTKVVTLIPFLDSEDVATGDGAGDLFFRVPSTMNGMNLVAVAACVQTAGTTNTTDVQIHNVTQAADMLTTKITIDSATTDSSSASTPAVIDSANDDVATGDQLRIDVDAVSTTAPKGLLVELQFRTP